MKPRERGYSLVIVLILLAYGALVITPRCAWRRAA